jgi:hypothetical protein
VPEERIFITRDSKAKSHQRAHPTKGDWSTDINLYKSDDFFKTEPQLVLEAGNTLVKTEAYMFVTRSHKDGSMVNVFSANYNSGFMKFHQATLPDGEVNLAHTFTITDTNEE